MGQGAGAEGAATRYRGARCGHGVVAFLESQSAQIELPCVAWPSGLRRPGARRVHSVLES